MNSQIQKAKERFKMNNKETKAWNSGNYNIPPKECLNCNTLNPSGNVMCYNCQSQF